MKSVLRCVLRFLTFAGAGGVVGAGGFLLDRGHDVAAAAMIGAGFAAIILIDRRCR